MNKITKLIAVFLFAASVASATTLVTVNGVKITQKDVDTELMNATQGRFNQVPPDKQAEFRKQVLEQLMIKELVYGDAKKTGVLKSKDFKKEFKKVQARVKKELAIQVWQKRVMDSIHVSNKELKKYYDKNKEEFNQKESVHARHILLTNASDAKAVIAQLKGLKGEALKAKFIELAKTKSTGPSGPRGGDLGYFVQGQMLPEFNDKVFSMKVGTITKEPLKTSAGYHVIYLEDKKPKQLLSFTEVKSFIEQRLKMEKFQAKMQKKITQLKNKATIK